MNLKTGQVWKAEDDEMQLLVKEVGSERAECIVLHGTGHHRRRAGHRVGHKASVAIDWLSNYCTVITEDYYATQ